MVSSVNFKDLQDIKEQIQDKVGIEDFRKIVDDKADRLSTIEAQNNKLDIEDLEGIIEKKVDIQEFEQLLSLVERKSDIGTTDHLFTLIEGKSDKTEIDQVMALLNKKAEKQELDKLNLDSKLWKSDIDKWIKVFDKTCQEYKRDLLTYKGENETLCEKINKKADRKETDRLTNILGRKVDVERMIEEVTRIKKEVQAETKNSKQNCQKIKEQVNSDLKEKNKKLEKGLELLGEEIGNLSVELNQVRAEHAKMLDDVVKNSKSSNTGLKREMDLSIDKLAEEIAVLGSDSKKLITEKLDKSDFHDIIKDVNKALGLKIEVDEVQASLNNIQADCAGKLIDLREEFIKAQKNQSEDLGNICAKKVI